MRSGLLAWRTSRQPRDTVSLASLAEELVELLNGQVARPRMPRGYLAQEIEVVVNTRPAIDPLFVSAADSFGSAVVGVVLSGVGEDGVVGAIAIKAKSGITLVQSPVEAMYPGMPTAALAKDSIDGVFSADNLAKVLVLLAKGAAVSEDHL